MTTSSLAATAGAARQRLAASLSALQQDPNLPAPILEIVSGLARAMGPLFQVERGTGAPELLIQARVVLQETLGQMQLADHSSHPGVADATGAIAQSLGMLFAAIKEHGIGAPSGAPAAVAQVVAAAPTLVAPPAPIAPPVAAPVAPPVAAPPVYVAPVVAPPVHVPPVAAPPVAAPPVHVPPVAAPPVAAPPEPVLLVRPAAAPVPLVQPAQVAVPLVHATSAASAHAPPQRQVEHAYFEPARAPQERAPSAASGAALPRLECELDVHSDSNFFTNFLGDIRDRGGIFVATFGTISAGAPCEVVISFPGSLTAEVRGIVRWRREANGDTGQIPGLGVEITQGSPDAWKLIERFIKNREPIIHEV